MSYPPLHRLITSFCRESGLIYFSELLADCLSRCHKFNKRKFLGIVLASSVAIPASAVESITLEQAIKLAEKRDPWLQRNYDQQSAIDNKSMAAGALPDPKVSIGINNVPTDTFNLQQDNMTQLQVGFSQDFPRGQSLAITQHALQIESSAFPLLRIDRKARLKSEVSQLWLDAFLAQQTIALIENDRHLFEKMADIAKVSFSSARGRTRQYDVIRADLELIQIEDRLTVEHQKLEVALAKLDKWLLLDRGDTLDTTMGLSGHSAHLIMDDKKPDITLLNANNLQQMLADQSQLTKSLSNHPAILAIGVKQLAAAQKVQLAKQSYQPQWGLKASYGFRGTNPAGSDRADLLSLGVSFNLPLFTENLQDKEVIAAQADASAVKKERSLLMRSMFSALNKDVQALKWLKERQKIYQTQLLKQSDQQVEAALSAYMNDDGDFSEFVTARITELNFRITALKFDVDVLKTTAKLNYFFTNATTDTDQATLQEFGE